MPEVLPDADDSVPERESTPLDSEDPARAARTSFQRRFFPQATPQQWNDWRWQLRHRIRDLESLERLVDLTPSERGVIEQIGGRLPVGITPYYASC